MTDHLADFDVEPEFDPLSPLAYLEKAAAAAEEDRTRLAVRAIRAMLAADVDAGVLIEARALAKRTRCITVEAISELVREARGTDAGRAEVPSAATALVEPAQEHYTFGISDTGEPFGIPNDGPKVVALLRGGKTSLRALLAREYFTRTGRAAAQQALADALLVIEGMAQEADELVLHVRCAHVGSALWLDVGDQTGRAIKVTGNGWRIEDETPVLFKRTSLTSPLPDPIRGGNLSGLWAWLNVTDGDKPLVAAALVAQLFSDQPHVILAILGEHGTGKSAAVKVMAGLLDPSPVLVRKPRRDADSWVTAAAGSWVVALDNLSDISPWFSDSLCRASTGDGDVRRQLYSDGDYAVFAFRRCIMFSAIDVGALAPDLADRTLPVALTVISDPARQDEESFWSEWQDAHPRLLGAVLDLAAQVLSRLPQVTLERKPRMADFGRILAAVDQVLGTSGLDRYITRSADLAADSLSGDSFAVRLQEIIPALGSFEGTSAKLLDQIGYPPGEKTSERLAERRPRGQHDHAQDRARPSQARLVVH